MKKISLLFILSILFQFAIAQPYDIYIWTTDGNGLAMGDVTVECDGETITTESGPMGGEAIFSGKTAGIYTFEATKTGHKTVTGEVTVTDQNASTTVVMLPAYDIYIVTNDGNFPMAMPVSDVTVECDGETIVSDFDGYAVFTGKPAGVYTFEASKAGHATVKGTVTVIDQNPMEFVGMLPAYDVTIGVTFDSNPIENATVEFNGNTMTTNASGMAQFTDVATGDHTYSISMAGYGLSTGTISVVDANVVENITLSLPSFDIMFGVGDGTDVIEGATITINGQTYTTDALGAYTVTGVSVGSYDYTIEAAGFVTQSGTIVIVDSDRSVVITLEKLYSITFAVTDGTNAIERATSTVGASTLTTDASGNATAVDLATGDHTYSVSIVGYVAASGSVTITNSNVTENVTLVINSIRMTENLSIKVYPNPTADFVNIAIPARAGNATISIYNTLGSKVMEASTNSNSTQIDISSLKNGVYFIKVESGGIKSSAKIIKK